MLTSLALIFLIGLTLGKICEKIKLPKIIGMLLTGMILGPYLLNFLDPTILNISADLRKLALIIILIKAGFSLDIQDLKKVGRPAFLLSFLPASFEIVAYTLIAPHLLGIDRIEAAIMGAVLAAVSPAVVVPRMVHLIENKIGTKKAIPQMIMAGSSCDDIFVLVLFSSFVGIAQGKGLKFTTFLNIPSSIILGIILGGIIGYILYLFFENSHKRGKTIRNSDKVIIILSLSFLLIAFENYVKSIISISGLLAVVSMACVLKIKTISEVSKRLSEKFGKLWIAAELLLFVLVGAAVNIKYTLHAGFSVVLMILLALIIRSIAVYISILGTNLNLKEKLFCIIAYMPKATVQAAIGSIPLALNLPGGELILSVAVMGIIITAPLGAIGIDLTYKKFLEQEK